MRSSFIVATRYPNGSRSVVEIFDESNPRDINQNLAHNHAETMARTNGGRVEVRLIELSSDADVHLAGIWTMEANAAKALADMPTLEDSFGCDPWSEENHGNHPASK